MRRRILVIGGLALLGVIALSGLYWRNASAAERERRGGWRVAVQAWTFNNLTLFEAIDKTREAGIRTIEAFPGQKISTEINVGFGPDAPLSALAQVKIKLEKAGVRLVNYGVDGIGKDEARARKLFDFAKMMGIQTIVAEPAKDAFDLLDKLTEEYAINVAIHNHPKPSTYWSPDIVLEAVKGHSKRIGACADTGHWMRSGIDPLEAVKKLEGRIISSHFKDLSEMGSGHDVVWGTGKGNVRAILAELNRQGFRGVFSIEYEHKMEGGEVKACADFFNQVTRELNISR